MRETNIMADTFLGTRRAVQRGGHWDNGARAGVFSMNVNNAPSNSNTNIGFRCPPVFSRREPGHPMDAGAKPILWRENFGVGLPNRQKSGGKKFFKSG
jgi:hypothetical protein